MAIRDFISNLGDGIRGSLDNLNERERRLVGLLAAVFGLLLVLLPLYLTVSAVSDLEDENAEIAAVLRDISKAQTSLASRAAEREARMARYQKKAPALSSFVEQQGRAVSLQIREVVEQPDKQMGGYKREHVRVTLPGVGLRSVVEMMANIENSGLPVALEQVQIEHFQAGDKYNVQLGVISFNRERSDQRSAEAEE